MNKAPVVSVVMSVYNGAKFLDKAINSILAQTYTDFEFLIVNDGSTDNSLNIINRAKKNDSRIKIIDQENEGLVTSLNKAISKASGKYIARMDADDISMPTRLEKQVKFLDSMSKVDILGTGFIFFNSNGSELGRQGVLVNDADIKRELCLRNPYGHGSVMMRREIFNQLGGYSNDVGPVEDYDLWLRFAKISTMAGLPDFLYKWRINPSGISQTNSSLQHTKASELATSFRRTHKYSVTLSYILKQRKYYKNINNASYIRFIEDQALFIRIFRNEKSLPDAIKSAIAVIGAPSFLFKEVSGTVLRIRVKLLSLPRRVGRSFK